MKYPFFITKWHNEIPKSLVVLVVGIFILGVGIFWLFLEDKKRNKKDVNESESQRDYWYRIEGEIDIWGLIIAGFITMLYGILLI